MQKQREKRRNKLLEKKKIQNKSRERNSLNKNHHHSRIKTACIKFVPYLKKKYGQSNPSLNNCLLFFYFIIKYSYRSVRLVIPTFSH